MIRSCNIAIYYRSLIYSNMKVHGTTVCGSWYDDVVVWGEILGEQAEGSWQQNEKCKNWSGWVWSRVLC